MLRALLIRHPWIDLILDGKKSWEIRGARTTIRGTVGLVASGSGTVRASETVQVWDRMAVPGLSGVIKHLLAVLVLPVYFGFLEDGPQHPPHVSRRCLVVRIVPLPIPKPTAA